MINNVEITLPKGIIEMGTIINNRTIRPNGEPLPIGAVVHTLDGDYLVTATGPKRVTSVEGFADKNNGCTQQARIYADDRFMDVTYITVGSGNTYTLVANNDYDVFGGIAYFKDSNNSNNAKQVQMALESDKLNTPSYSAILDFIAIKNGGCVTWNGGKTVATVSMKVGNTVAIKSYKASDIKTVNGKIIMSAGNISKDFGIFGTKTFHTFYDSFNNEDEAAMAFSLSNRAASEKAGIEYMACIYSNTANKQYFYGKVSTNGTKNTPKQPDTDMGFARTSWIHTHADYKSGNQLLFSGWMYKAGNTAYEGDAVAAIINKKIGMNFGYLITNEGILKKLDPSKLGEGPPIYSPASQDKYRYISDSHAAVTIVAKGLK
jgi:hypothetical protein